jgi:hypothetical protein
MCSRNTELVEKFVVTTNVWKKRKFKEIVTHVPIYSTPMYGTVLWIRIRSDPKLLAGSGPSCSGSDLIPFCQTKYFP